MRKLLLAAGLAAAALIPSLALAQPSCGQQRDNQVGATIVGGALGAVVGSAVAPRGDGAAGAVIGGVGGAVIGNQVDRPDADCSHAYGYYDRNSQWHVNDIDQANARGYYDRDGAWVDGAPNGYYDGSGRWIAGGNDPQASGYRDAHGRFIPASAGGYFDDGGQWVASVSGYYDDGGRWVAGQTTGAYDARGHWVTGASRGHTDANGAWIADPQTGYYDANHLWRVGPAQGYYDARGVWIGSAATTVGYDLTSSFEGAPERRDVDTREAWLEQRIRSSGQNGSLSQYDAATDLGALDSIRRQETRMRDASGQLSQQDESRLQTRLDDLSSTLRASLKGA